MTLAQLLSDIYETFAVQEAHAEAPPADKDDSSSDDSGEKTEGSEEEKKEEPEAEEEEEEEPVDVKDDIEAKCQETECSKAKHHYDECAERVTAAAEAEGEEHHKGPKEDCVEEFFHLMHCTGDCTAPKLFKNLK